MNNDKLASLFLYSNNERTVDGRQQEEINSETKWSTGRFWNACMMDEKELEKLEGGQEENATQEWALLSNPNGLGYLRRF